MCFFVLLVLKLLAICTVLEFVGLAPGRRLRGMGMTLLCVMARTRGRLGDGAKHVGQSVM